jgi:superfamily II DNA/RNA helicase
MSKTLRPVQLEFLKNLSITELNPMQDDFVHRADSAGNLMLLAPTGSGKTVAFLLPLLQKLKPEGKTVQAMILAPTRELVLQIEDVFRTMKTSYKVSVCYGGHSMKIEENSLSEAPAVVIGTPGRLADHFRRKSFDPSGIRLVVLDEFDKSLQMGFHEQLKGILKVLSGGQQYFLTSATRLAELPDFMPFKNPEIVDYLKEEKTKLQLKLVRTNSTDKVETLMRLVAGFDPDASLIFCNHRDAVDRISLLFEENGLEHGILHGAMEQIDREKSLIKFRSGAHHILIATDLASRGLDIPEIRHVVHYQLPLQQEAFIHRNGRTARMHSDGIAYLILADDESLPAYISPAEKEMTLPKKLKLPPKPEYACVYISAGKKDKISKGDIAGLLMKKGGLQGDEIGLITTLDHASYVAVKRSLVSKVLTTLANEKLKKLKVKIAVAN